MIRTHLVKHPLQSLSAFWVLPAIHYNYQIIHILVMFSPPKPCSDNKENKLSKTPVRSNVGPSKKIRKKKKKTHNVRFYPPLFKLQNSKANHNYYAQMR